MFELANASSWPVSAAWLVGLALLIGMMATRQPEVVCARDEPVEDVVCTRDEGAAERRASGGDPAKCTAELEAWERMWDELESEGVHVFAPDLQIAGARYAGDTCGMRYRRLYRGVGTETRERMVLAAFANDPDTKRRLLLPLLDSPDERIRARAAVELARVGLRRGDLASAQAALEHVVGLDIPDACESDVRHIDGRIALRRGDATAALAAFEAASELDPGHWNAYHDRLPVLVHALHVRGLGTAACLQHARTLIEVLGLLPQLADDTRQFAKLALSLERLGARSSATLLAAGMTWRWAGQEAYGRGILARALDAPELLPQACESEIRKRIALALESS